MLAQRLEPRDQRRDRLRILRQVLAARLGDRIALPGALALLLFDLPQLVEQRQRRIDDARAGSIALISS
jgi:hypothetical protein